MPSSRARKPSSTSSSDDEEPRCSPAWEAFDDVLRLLSRSLHDAQDVATDVAKQMCQAGGGMPQVVKRDHKALHDGCKVRAEHLSTSCRQAMCQPGNADNAPTSYACSRSSASRMRAGANGPLK